MRRMLLLAVTAALLVAGSAGSAAGARDQPELIVRQGCQYLFDGLYGGQFDVVGLEPNTRYFFYYVGIGGSSFTTDEHGAYVGVGGGDSSEPFELTVQISNAVPGNQSIVLQEHIAFTRPCTDFPAVPTRRSECKKGGWRSFGRFKNQGQCIRFVKHGPKRHSAGLRD
jgi:hypothetical protein